MAQSLISVVKCPAALEGHPVPESVAPAHAQYVVADDVDKGKVSGQQFLVAVLSMSANVHVLAVSMAVGGLNS